MSDALVSLKTRNEFREYFVGIRLREIEQAFDAGEVECDLNFTPSVGGQRRTLVEQYYSTVDWSDWRSVRRVVEVYETLIYELLAPPDSSWLSSQSVIDSRKSIAEKLLYWLKKDGYSWINDRLVRDAGNPALEDLASAGPLEGTYVALQIQRMKDAVDTDPFLAIGTAKELIETVCKTILEERGKPVEGTPDIPTLTKLVLKELKLVPDGVHEATRGADLVKTILRSLGTIGNDLAQLRGLYGTGHGKAAKTRGLQPRHAKLAVGTAGTLATFLLETHRETATAKAA